MNAPFGRQDAMWRSVPRVLRRAVCLVVGGTLMVIGLALVWLPGPFTIPLVAAGIAVLATEFAWAATLMAHGKRAASAAKRRVTNGMSRGKPESETSSPSGSDATVDQPLTLSKGRGDT